MPQPSNELFVKVYSYEQEYDSGEEDDEPTMCMRADGEDDIENTDWYEYPDIDDE